jgi:tRNA (cmo5U34)-methyltransferase
MKDQVFSKTITKQFEFDDSVARVFDDMLNRSVPYYQLSSDLMIDYITKLFPKKSKVFDLGCSTANTLIALDNRTPKRYVLSGIDSSSAMLEQAKQKALAFGVELNLLEGDMLTTPFSTQDIFIANYTLQFIRPRSREQLITKIYDALAPDGVLFFSEKVVSSDTKISKVMIESYYSYKKEHGYSEFEIAQKREALENVLVPYTISENIAMVLDNGFSHCETLFQWNNFVTFIARK